MSIEGLAAREAAFDCLLDYSTRGIFVSESLSWHGARLEGRDRALALETALSTIRWKARLDHHLEGFLRGATPEPVRWLLRMGLAQCRILDRIPPHAAVHLSVELARARFGKGASGLVNAVLRRAIEAPWRDPEGDTPADLAVRFSHPEWLVYRWIKRHGVETTRAMLEAGSREPEAWVRVRRGATDLPWDPAAETARLHDGFFRRLSIGRERVLGSDAFRRGDVSFQDPSSGACALALSGFLEPGMVLADLCAAPGGKLACLRDHGDLDGVRVLAFDLSPARQLRTIDGFRRLALDGFAAVADATSPPLRESSVDALLVDAPCSNLGVLSRRPEARWRIRPDEPRLHGKLQRRMLEAAIPCVRPGGRIVYSTCSTEPEEGDDVVRGIPGCRVESAATSLPGLQDGDGFFLATLVRT